MLDDLSVIGDDAIRARRMDAIARLTLFALVRGAAEDFFRCLATSWAAELNIALTGASRELGMSFLLYAFHRNPHMDPETALQMILPEVEPDAKETIVTIADQLIQRGRAEGIEKVLLRLLAKRFGPLPGHVSARVARASGTELEGWTDRVLDAASLGASRPGAARQRRLSGRPTISQSAR